MSEKPDETKSAPVLRVHIKHDNPIKAGILGEALCAFSNEFILFLMSREEYENSNDLALCVKEINRGSMIIDFIINNINNIVSNANYELLPLFFEYLRIKSLDFRPESMIKIAIFALMFNIKIELFSNNTVKHFTVINNFNIDVRNAEKIPAYGIEKVFGNLKDEFVELKDKQIGLENKINRCFEFLANKSNENTGENNETR